MTDIELEETCELYQCLNSAMKGYRSVIKQKSLEFPDFTLIEFVKWAKRQPDYAEVANIWRHSGYAKQYRPKMKMIHRHKSCYTLSNLILSSYDKLQAEYESTH